MPRVVVEVSGGVARVESSSDEVDVLFFDYDELVERCGADRLAPVACAPKDGTPLTPHDPEVCHAQILLRLTTEAR